MSYVLTHVGISKNETVTRRVLVCECVRARARKLIETYFNPY